MNELGERIRQLRKEKKMTLVDVAGEHLSKGMLSLIENGRAKPSIESLTHIAHQLGVDVHVLLEEKSSVEIKQLLQETEEKIEIAEKDFLNNLNEKYKKIYQDLKPIYEQKLPTTYETGRLFELGGRCLMNTEKVEKGRMLIDKSVQIYESLSLFNHALKAQLRYIGQGSVIGFDQVALEQLYALLDKYKEKITVMDTVVQIEIDYLELLMLFGIGEYEKGKEVLNRLLTFSKRKGVFHLMDDIYRVAAYHALINRNSGDFKHFILKSQQFALFTDNEETYGFTLFIEAHYHNEITKDHDQAFVLLERVDELVAKVGVEIGGYYYMEKGKAFYGKGHFDKAMEQFELFELPTTAGHPMDLSMLYTVDAYRARCLVEKGNYEEACQFAKRASDNVARLPHTPYHTFIEETLYLVNQNQGPS